MQVLFSHPHQSLVGWQLDLGSLTAIPVGKECQSMIRISETCCF